MEFDETIPTIQQEPGMTFAPLTFDQITSEPTDDERSAYHSKIAIASAIRAAAEDLEIPDTRENFISPPVVRNFRRGLWRSIGANVEVEEGLRFASLQLRDYYILLGCPGSTLSQPPGSPSLWLAKGDLYVGGLSGLNSEYIGGRLINECMWPVDCYTLRFVPKANLEEALMLLEWLRSR